MSQPVYFVMDPIENVNLKKDTTLALMFEAFKRGFKVYTTEPNQLMIAQDQSDQPKLRKTEIYSLCRQVHFQNDIETFVTGKAENISLHNAKYVFMRQDPPVTIEYITATFILERLEEAGVRVVNHPGHVRASNEKLTALRFPDLAPQTIVSSQKSVFKAFLEDKKDIIIKPLDGMGGQGIFRVKHTDQNIDTIIEVLSKNGHLQIMAQEYIPEIIHGDKRIIMINGSPIPFALARIPQNGALRGNLAAGGQGVGQELTERDLEICREVGPWLKANKIYLAGLDVIGRYLTEVNVTSPTCVRELDKLYNLNISAQLFDALEIDTVRNFN